MVVINWFKDTLDSGHKLFLRSLKSSNGSSSRQKLQIISEQRALAEHFRKSSGRFIEKLENLTDKISNIDNAGPQTAVHIKQRQQSLFYACLRLEIALKTNSELRRERKEWERRLPCTAELDAYHPLVRLELIDSELKVREERLLAPQDQATPAIEVIGDEVIVECAPKQDEEEIIEMPGVRIVNSKDDSDALKTLDHEQIVRRAEGILMEIASNHNNAGSNTEYLEKTDELRELHKILRQLQKNNRYNKYRLRLRERMNQLFT
jgi:hypothetical protein